VFWRSLLGVLEIFDGCGGDIRCVPGYILLGFWRYLIIARRYLIGVLEIFDQCNGDI